MEYVLVMALSGTTMTCLYLLARCLLRKKLSAGTYFLLAKAAVFYYLIPLPFVKNWYRELFSETTLVSRMGTERISLTWTKYLVHANGGLHANGYAVIQTGMAIVWMAGAVVLLIKQLIEYVRITHWFAGYAQIKMTDREKLFIDSLRREYGVRRRVSLIPALNGPPVKWKAGFGNHIKEINERMENLMRKNKWNRYAAGVLAVVLIFANSMTVFAYRDPVSAVLPDDVSEEEIKTVFDKDISVFAPVGTEGAGEQDFDTMDGEMLYEKQFVDEEGNVFPVPEDEGVELHCSHVYVAGEIRDHYPKSDGSCVIKYYNGERCARCGQIVYHELINTCTWAVCPH